MGNILSTFPVCEEIRILQAMAHRSRADFDLWVAKSQKHANEIANYRILIKRDEVRATGDPSSWQCIHVSHTVVYIIYSSSETLCEI
jgi:hypothetical protein